MLVKRSIDANLIVYVDVVVNQAEYCGGPQLSRQNKKSRHYKLNSRQNKINSRQNKENELVSGCYLNLKLYVV